MTRETTNTKTCSQCSLRAVDDFRFVSECSIVSLACGCACACACGVCLSACRQALYGAVLLFFKWLLLPQELWFA